MLLENKLIDANQKITFYVPEVKNSAFDNAIIRNLLDMTIATDFREEYLDKTEYLIYTGKLQGLIQKHPTII